MRDSRQIGLALARILTGCGGILFYAGGYASREFLWGPRSPIPFDVLPPGASMQPLALSFSLYRLSTSPFYFQLLFHMGLVTAILFTVFGGRALTLAHWALFTSLLERNPYLLDGGESLARILLFFFVFVDTNLYFAPGAPARRQTGISTNGLEAHASRVAVALCVFQVALVYLTAGVAKLQGEEWRNGTALYYIARVEPLQAASWLEWLTAYPLVSALGSYGVVALQLAYPLTLLNRRAHTVAVVLTVAMHAAIGVMLGLTSFALIMIGANALVVPDSTYRAAAKWRPAWRAATTRQAAEAGAP